MLESKRIRKLLRRQRPLVRAYFSYRYLRRDPYGSQNRGEKERVKKALSLVAGTAASDALEIGCGEGYGARLLAQVATEVLAIDISGTAIRRAKRLHRACQNLTFERADFLTAPLTSSAYDLVYCSEVLYYLEPELLKPACRKIVDLLKPQGRLLLVHHRTLRDDTSGTMDKSFGAKTIHDAFAGLPELGLEKDLLEPHYRITLFRRLAVSGKGKAMP